MSEQEIKDLVSVMGKKNDSLSLFDIGKIKAVANIRLEMDREANEYFYIVPIKELVNKPLDEKIITENKWLLSDDENYLIYKI